LEIPNTLPTFANTQTAAHCDMRRELQNKSPWSELTACRHLQGLLLLNGKKNQCAVLASLFNWINPQTAATAAIEVTTDKKMISSIYFPFFANVVNIKPATKQTNTDTPPME
jgi:hypothetical protein